MHEFYPLIAVGGIIGIISIIFLIAYLSIKDKKESIGFDRNMKDSELAKRLLVYVTSRLDGHRVRGDTRCIAHMLVYSGDNPPEDRSADNLETA